MIQNDRRTERSDALRNTGIANRILFARTGEKLDLRHNTTAVEFDKQYMTPWGSILEHLATLGVVEATDSPDLWIKRVEHFGALKFPEDAPIRALKGIPSQLYSEKLQELDLETKDGRMEFVTAQLWEAMRGTYINLDTPDFTGEAKNIASAVVDMMDSHVEPRDGKTLFIDLKILIVSLLKENEEFVEMNKGYDLAGGEILDLTDRMVEDWAGWVCSNRIVKKAAA